MCDPISIGIGLAVTGGVVGAGGQLMAGVEAQKTSNANAKALYDRAADVDEKAKYDIDQLKRNFTRKHGSNVARIASADLNVATFGDVMADDALESFLERKAVRYSADTEIRDLNRQAKAEIRAGKNARKASYFDAAGTLINAGSQAVTLASQFSTAQGNASSGVSLK